MSDTTNTGPLADHDDTDHDDTDRPDTLDYPGREAYAIRGLDDFDRIAETWVYKTNVKEIDQESVRLASHLLRTFLSGASEYAQEKFCKSFTEVVPFAWTHNRTQLGVMPDHLHPGARGFERDQSKLFGKYKDAISRTLGMIQRQHRHFLTFLPHIALAEMHERVLREATRQDVST